MQDYVDTVNKTLMIVLLYFSSHHADFSGWCEEPRMRRISNKSAEENAAHSFTNAYNGEHRRDTVAVNNAASNHCCNRWRETGDSALSRTGEQCVYSFRSPVRFYALLQDAKPVTLSKTRWPTLLSKQNRMPVHCIVGNQTRIKRNSQTQLFQFNFVCCKNATSLYVTSRTTRSTAALIKEIQHEKNIIWTFIEVINSDNRKLAPDSGLYVKIMPPDEFFIDNHQQNKQKTFMVLGRYITS